jgi:hypothetical protein
MELNIMPTVLILEEGTAHPELIGAINRAAEQAGASSVRFSSLVPEQLFWPRGYRLIDDTNLIVLVEVGSGFQLNQYILGYVHGRQKPMIHLTRGQEPLPFDTLEGPPTLNYEIPI